MNYFVLVWSLCLFGWRATAAETNRPLKLFREQNFGVTFNHSEDITTDYNPHGGATQVALSRKGTPIGGLKVLRPYPKTNDAEFVEGMKKHFKEVLNASSIEHREFENPQKYRFHVFKAKLIRGGSEYITERFVHQRRRTAKDENEAFLDRMFGVFMFDFIAPAVQYPALKQDIDTVINSFRLKDGP